MKKVFAFALVLALVVSLAVPAFAASPAATKNDLTPTVVSTECDKLQILTAEDIAKLPEEAQKAFAEAKESLAEVVPQGMAVRYFFYVDVCEICGVTTVTIRIADYSEVVVMQYVDGEWVTLEYTVNADGTITVKGVVSGPMAIFVK